MNDKHWKLHGSPKLDDYDTCLSAALLFRIRPRACRSDPLIPIVDLWKIDDKSVDDCFWSWAWHAYNEWNNPWQHMYEHVHWGFEQMKFIQGFPKLSVEQRVSALGIFWGLFKPKYRTVTIPSPIDLATMKDDPNFIQVSQ